MKISRSPRALEILGFIVKNEPRTLYKIYKEKSIPYASLHLAVKNLVKKNLAKLDLERSRNKGRNATVYVPTFKGILVFLSDYHLPQHPTGYRIRQLSEEKEEAIKKLKEKIKKGLDTYKREVEKLKDLLEKNGQMLRYPLFQYCRSLGLHPRLYEIFIRIAQEVLETPFQMSGYEQSLLVRKTKLEKDLMKAEKLSTITDFRLIVSGVERPFDPAGFYKQQLEGVNLVLNVVITKEDEILKESFFIRFMRRFQSFQKLPNQELHNYTLMLLEKKEKEFNSIKAQLEKGMALFRKS